MEGMSGCRKQLEELRCRARAQMDAAKVLQESLAEEADYLRRRDQAQCLDDLRARVKREVEMAQLGETTASLAFTEETFTSGLFKFAFGSLAGALLRPQEHPLSYGARLAKCEFARSKPFGTVMVVIGTKGIPNDVQVISLSQLVRDQSRSEDEITAILESRGYKLMAPGIFFSYLSELKDNVSMGMQSLPVSSSALTLKPAQQKQVTATDTHAPKRIS